MNLAHGILFDLDDTLVDTARLKDLRTAKRWREAVQRVAETAPFPGIPELIDALVAGCVPWAVITTSVSFYSSAVLRHHRFFPATLVSYHDAPAKPQPAGVVLAMSRLALGPNDVIGIGDSSTDLLAYRAAGVRAFGAGWSPVLAEDQWDGLLPTPADLLSLVAR